MNPARKASGAERDNLLDGIDPLIDSENARIRQRRNSAMMDDRAKNSQANYTETVNKLNKYYQLVKKQIMRHISPITGLFPADLSQPKVIIGHVRDSIYCASAMWALSQAYKRIDDDRGRTQELSLTAVKTMRGILECWMYQADKVEKFKSNQHPKNSLHVLFNMITNEPITEDEEYEHLQIDCVALYLIFLVQMIQSGLQIIYTTDEVNFIQNLVFYVERAYRTPDFGMWERGSKYNNGSSELHASSIGLAKAALESINGENLFGSQGSSWSVIYVDIDAHNRNRTIFDTILPRESNSKNTDASLIPTVSWPAFAIHEEQLVNRTLDKALRKLKGEYGLKRFLRDGYGTDIEDKTRRYYQPSDIKNFDGIECEWPMFYCYLAIDCIYKGENEKAAEYMNMLKPLLVEGEDGPLVPKYYFVPKDRIEEERKKPGSQRRLPSGQGCVLVGEEERENVFLWGQSVYIIAQLLVEGLLNISELDPIRRNLPAAERPRPNSRYSSFQRGSAAQSSPTDLVIQVVLIAESVRLQQMLATFGIQTQTPHQIEPIQIWPPSELAKAYEQLGVNAKLGLSGRPPRPFGGLGTSKIYRACGYTFLCYPLLFEVSDFYLSQDMEFVIEDVKSDLTFLGKCWKLAGRPTFCMLLREENLRCSGAPYIMDLLAAFKHGDCDGTKVRLGRLQEFISSACIEHLDFLDIDVDIGQFKQFTERDKGKQFRSLTDIPKIAKVEFTETWIDDVDIDKMTVWDVVQEFGQSDNMYYQAQLLQALMKREGLFYNIDTETVEQKLEKLAHKAGTMQVWSIVRFCSALLGKVVDSLAPSITAILVRGKQLTISVWGQQEHVVDKPVSPNDIREILYTRLYPYDPIQAVLQQELIINIGTYITTSPELFLGILKIRIGWIVEAMRRELEETFASEKVDITTLSPSCIKKLLYKVVRKKSTDTKYYSPEKKMIFNRQLDGCLSRVPNGFYEKVWHILERTPSGIQLAGYLLPQQPTLSDMTQYELNFSLLVEQMLCKIIEPAYRQIIVESFCIVERIISRNPEMSFKKPIDMDKIVLDAVGMFANDYPELKDSKDNELIMDAFYNTPQDSDPETNTKGTNIYIVRAVANTLLQGDLREGFSSTHCVVS